jgi:putative phosphoribosyl transferase
MIPINGFRDRIDAGQALASELSGYSERDDVTVLALPRGGVPVAREICKALSLPMDVFLVRKVGLPSQPELAMGAIATGDIQLLDDVLIAEAHLTPADVSAAIARETAELARRESLYRGDLPPLQVAGRIVILVDDGVATGYTMRVAILALRKLSPVRLVVAVPVGAPETCDILDELVDELVCPLRPNPFHAVGLVYDHFPPLTDDDVRDGIAQAAKDAAHRPHGSLQG